MGLWEEGRIGVDGSRLVVDVDVDVVIIVDVDVVVIIADVVVVARMAAAVCGRNSSSLSQSLSCLLLCSSVSWLLHGESSPFFVRPAA